MQINIDNFVKFVKFTKFDIILCMNNLQHINNNLYNPNRKVRFNSIRELVTQGDSSVVPYLRKFVLIEKDNELLFYARKSLDLLTSNVKKNISLLEVSDHEFIECLYSGNTSSKIEVITKVIKLNKKKYLKHILEALFTEKDNFVIATLVKAAGYLGEYENILNLKPFLKSADARVRANTCEAIAILGEEKVFDIIFPMIHDVHPRVKITAANYIVNYSQTEPLENIFNEMAESKKVSDKTSLLFLFDKINSPRYSSIIIKLTRDSNYKIASRAKEILEKISRNSIDYKSIDEFETLSKINVKNTIEEKKEKNSTYTFYDLTNQLEKTTNPDEQKNIILRLEKLGDLRTYDILKKFKSESKVVNYFRDRALNKFENIRNRVIICPNCGFQIRKEEADSE